MANRDLASWSHMWFVAAHRQATRALGLAADGPSGLLDVELLMYVEALNNLRRGAEVVLTSEHQTLTLFDDCVPDLRAVRNQVEHFDEYVSGRGRLQKRQYRDGLQHAFWTTGVDGANHTIDGLTSVNCRLQIYSAGFRSLEGSSDEWSTVQYEIDVVTSLCSAIPLARDLVAQADLSADGSTFVREAEEWAATSKADYWFSRLGAGRATRLRSALALPH